MKQLIPKQKASTFLVWLEAFAWFRVHPWKLTAGSLEKPVTGPFKYGPCLSFVRSLGCTPSKNTKDSWGKLALHLFVRSTCDKNGKFHAELGMLHTKKMVQLISSFKKQIPSVESTWFLYTIPKVVKPPINRKSYLHPSHLACWVTMPNGKCFKWMKVLETKTGNMCIYIL